MSISRRTFLATTAAATLPSLTTWAHAQSQTAPIGIGSSSYGIRSRSDAALKGPLEFLEFCQEQGAAGIQTPLGIQDPEYCRQLRSRADQLGMYLEGSSATPRSAQDVERFAAEVRTAREAGAKVIRSVMLGGRRYETFDDRADFQKFAAESRQRLQWAEPVLSDHKMYLAVENHKDFRADALAELMRQIDSEYVGVCLDMGNNMALLEMPQHTAEVLLPWTHSCHIKDMSVQPYEEGFLLAEVPLGEGLLDLPELVGKLRRQRPHVQFSLEMITRDPLHIPCLTDHYWATLSEVPAVELARMMRYVRQNSADRPLPKISQLLPGEQVAAEQDHVRRSLLFARQYFRS